ncbi:glycosyltransferase family 2 protein [Streptococcus suis]|uniref:Glycosyl transferase family protein n=1 Tax=Streptococcus suis TaxID=1307 RepID=A0A116QEP9_STRSU|nr:glycosyltransferase family 2 protein [Streptococcus suis]NQP75403.1 glycosyltransferase family 2 protein [Streptococcus suis]NQP77431.1 glycosyltransferase family 2 protein [Streptococcus suis]NQP91772.1 glycosyltransferase family 2 protein [Streptococcus suis]NQP93715.1 glycosyltransferase family 2 protein [Streptococcus suis]NQS63824.1 glycosyltransferase family 2 protein [Streptococcus suis]
MLKISVIVPIYNVEKYIEDCVNSVITQTYTNYELILVNDASPDNSLELIKKLAKNNSKIHIIDKQTNEGVSLARSAGLHASTGDMVLFLDGDDTLIPTALEMLAQKYKRYNSDIIVFSKIQERDGKLRETPYFSKEILFDENNKTKLYEGFLDYGYFVIGYAAINRELALQYDMANEIKHIWIGEDLVQSLPLLTYAKKVLYIPEGLYVMTNNPDSVTRANSLRKDRYQQAILTHNYIEDYLTRWEIADLNEIFYRHIMEDALLYASLGVKATNSMSDAREYLLTIAKDTRFQVAYRKGYPQKIKKRLIAFLLKNKLFRLYFYLIKLKSGRLK